MGRSVTAATLACAALALAACAGPRVIEADVTIRSATVPVYVADTESERSTGLQGVELDGAGGMLFVWASSNPRAFAIKQVGYPLDVVWISADGRVTGVSSLAPGGPERAESPGAVAAVLEVPAGWAERHAVRPGDAVTVRER